jgi:hypothetical protein
MNEPSSLPSPTQSTTPLRSLQEILHNRIIQKKGEIHKSHNRAYNDNLWTEIETLQWILDQILMLLRRSPAAQRVTFFEPDQMFFDTQ